MKELDFRPDWYCVARMRKRNFVIRVTLLSVLGAELVLGSLGIFAQKADAQEELTELRRAFDHQGVELQDLDRQFATLAELRRKRALLSDVTGGAPTHMVLAELSRLMPRDMVLTSVKFTQERSIGTATIGVGVTAKSTVSSSDDESGKLEITGYAPSDVDVGMLMSNLSKSALFRDVTLLYSHPNVVNALAARKFQLTCAVPQFE